MHVKILRSTTGMILHNGHASIRPPHPGFAPRIAIHAGSITILLDGPAVKAIAEAWKQAEKPPF